jgi:hypothetical protein
MSNREQPRSVALLQLLGGVLALGAGSAIVALGYTSGTIVVVPVGMFVVGLFAIFQGLSNL